MYEKKGRFDVAERVFVCLFDCLFVCLGFFTGFGCSCRTDRHGERWKGEKGRESGSKERGEKEKWIVEREEREI